MSGRATIDIRPGETQRWRILNGSSDKFLVIRLQGHSMWQIANDGNPLAKTIRTTAQFLGPGERREILVRAGSTRGRFAFQSMNFVPVTKQPGYSAPTRTIATMVVAGEAVAPRPIPTELVPVEDLRDPSVKIARKRQIVLSEGFDPGPPPVPSFFINGKEFDAARIDNVTIGPNGGSVTWRSRFTDFTGKFVMHCHVLFHEDNGMMSAVRVAK
jgi:FtsP/CotA-like multicopper oxidase with cupredoxin domain